MIASSQPRRRDPYRWSSMTVTRPLLLSCEFACTWQLREFLDGIFNWRVNGALIAAL